jgi:branched-chain amino acid transport system ATP-binding protein
MLKVEALRVSFGDFLAVSRADLVIGEGEIVAVIGPNGAGKTTLFNAITGQLRVDGGRITFKNENITGLPPHVICRKGMSRSYQVVNIFPRLTVFENVQAAVLTHHRKSYNLFTPARSLLIKETMSVLESVGLSGKAQHVSGVLSHGDQKVLEMAIALANKPKMLILDEPTAGMSPEETAIMIKLIKSLSSDMGLTILFCEHDMSLVFSIAQSIMVMSHGRTILQGYPDEVRRNEEVQKAYLGGTK